jgi:hypothetical protein
LEQQEATQAQVAEAVVTLATQAQDMLRNLQVGWYWT